MPNKITNASWTRGALKCPHCHKPAGLHLVSDIFRVGEGMVIGCGGGLDLCVRIPIRHMAKIDVDLKKIYTIRQRMAEMLVESWNKHHSKKPKTKRKK